MWWLEPRIYDLDAGAVEVGHVTGGQHGDLGPADGRDQRVEAGDRLACPLTVAGDDRVMLCGCYVDRQDLVVEGREDFVGCGEEDLLSAPVRKPGNAVPDLRERDGGGTQFAPVSVADPVRDLRRRLATTVASLCDRVPRRRP